MTEKSENQSQSQSQNAAKSMPSPRILPKVDPAKTINYRKDGADPSRIQK
jgi:DNA-nicking Smr family endonuclease